MKYLRVTFDSQYHNPKKYAFKTELDVEKGDYVVVCTKNKDCPSIAKVVSVSDIPDQQANALVASKVDLTYYEEALAKEERRKTIIKTLEAKRKAMLEVDMYSMLASQDSSAAALLEELKSL